MIATRLVIAAAAVLCAAAATAQTFSERLEKGIYTEETAGDLDGAARIFEGIVGTPGVPRDIASRAQLRASSIRRRLQVARAAIAVAPEHQRAAAVTAAIPSPADGKASYAQTAATAERCCAANYDMRQVTVSGPIVQMEWTNPQVVMYVKGDDGKLWGFTVASPNMMLGTGWNKNTPALGNNVIVWAYLAKGTGGTCPTQLPNACETLMNGALHATATSITLDNKQIFDRVAVEALERRLREEREASDRQRQEQLQRGK